MLEVLKNCVDKHSRNYLSEDKSHCGLPEGTKEVLEVLSKPAVL